MSFLLCSDVVSKKENGWPKGLGRANSQVNSFGFNYVNKSLKTAQMSKFITSFLELLVFIQDHLKREIKAEI
jgi:hypothetical protein